MKRVALAEVRAAERAERETMCAYGFELARQRMTGERGKAKPIANVGEPIKAHEYPGEGDQLATLSFGIGAAYAVAGLPLDLALKAVRLIGDPRSWTTALPFSEPMFEMSCEGGTTQMVPANELMTSDRKVNIPVLADLNDAPAVRGIAMAYDRLDDEAEVANR